MLRSLAVIAAYLASLAATVFPWGLGLVSYARTENWWGLLIGALWPPVAWINGLINLF